MITECSKVIKVYESFVLGKCSCGCGNDIPIKANSKHELRRYIKNHNNYGSTNPIWKGGSYIEVIKVKGGKEKRYRKTRKPDHPFAVKGYVKTHRLVYEHYLKILFDEDIYIPPEIDIHHNNENTLDNSLINLTALEHGEHSRNHKIGKKR